MKQQQQEQEQEQDQDQDQELAALYENLFVLYCFLVNH
jgi:hypothetical protein